MGSLKSDYPQSRFLTIRKSLDDFGYRDSFTIDSLPLVDKLFIDLLKISEDHKKLTIQAHHHQKIFEELEEGVGPFKEENLRLIKENSALRLDALKSKEKLDEGLQGSKSKLRNLESENADLKLLVGQFVERVKKLEIDSLVKTRKLAQFQEKNLQATINIMSDEKCQKVGVKQKMEMDYPIPNMCQYCVKVKNTVDHKPKRDPVAIDYMKIADARIEALHIQNRELKRTQDDLKNLITSMKEKIKGRDEEINQFRGSNLRKYEDKKNEKVMNGFDTNDSEEQNKDNKLIKILQLQLEISQRKNIQLEKTLRSSLSLGASINGKFYDPVKDLCSDFESFGNYDTHSLQAKVIQLEKQLSHCCKEKAKLKLLLEALGIAENSSMYEKLTSNFSRKDNDNVDKCYVPSTHSSPEKRTTSAKGKSESSSVRVPEQAVEKSSQILWKRSSKPLSSVKRIGQQSKSSTSSKTKEMVEKLSSFDPKLSKRLKDDSDKKLSTTTTTSPGIVKQVPLSSISTQSKSLEKAKFKSSQQTATTQTQPVELEDHNNVRITKISKKDLEERENLKHGEISVEENRNEIEFHPANIDELSLSSSDSSTCESSESESSTVDERSFKKGKEPEIKNGAKLIVQRSSKTRISSPQRQRIKPTIDYPSPNKIKQKHYQNGSGNVVTGQKSKAPFQSMSESDLHLKKGLPSKKSEMMTSKKDFITVKTAPKMPCDDEKRKLPGEKSKSKHSLHQSTSKSTLSTPKPTIFKENDDQIKPSSTQSSKLKVRTQDSSFTNVDDQSDDDPENLKENFDKIERRTRENKHTKPNLDLEKAQRPQTRRSKIISVVQNQDSIASFEDQHENISTLSSSSKPASASKSKSKTDSKARENLSKKQDSLDSIREDQYSLQKSKLDSDPAAKEYEDKSGNEFEEKEEELSLLERMRQHKLKPAKSSKSKSHEKTHSTTTSSKGEGEEKLKPRSKSEDKLSGKKYSSTSKATDDDQKKSQHKKVSKSQDNFDINAEKTRKRDHKTAENLDESILVITSAEESDDVPSEPEHFNQKNVSDIERYASPLDSDLRKGKSVHSTNKDYDEGKGETSSKTGTKKSFKSTEPNILKQDQEILGQKQQKSEKYSPTTNANANVEDKVRPIIQESIQKSGPDHYTTERKEQNIPPSQGQGYLELEQPKIDWQRNSKVLSESPYYDHDKYKPSPSSTTANNYNVDSRPTFKSSDQTKSQEYLRGGPDRIYDQNPLDRSSLDRSRDKILAYEESSSSRYLPMVGPSPQSYYQIGQLEEENSRLKVALMDMDKDKDDIRFELDRKDEEMARLQRENVRGLEDLAKLQQRLSQAEILMGRTDTDVRVNEREAMVLRRQIENLREDRELLMRERDEALRELKRLQLSQSKDLSVKRSISTELEKKTKETDELKRQIQKYIDEVRRAEELLREKDEEMERLLDHFRSLTVERSNLESAKSILEKETNNFRQEARDVSDQNALLKNQLASQADLLKTYEEEIENLTRNVVHTQAKLDSREESEKILTQDMNSAKELILKLETNLDHVRLQLSTNDSSKNRLESENADLVKHLENLETGLKQEEDNRLTLEELILRNREKDYEIERNNAELLTEKEDLIDQIQRLETKVQSMTQDITSHRLKSVELQNEIDRLRRQLENERLQRESLESKFKTIQQNFNSSSGNVLLGSFEESFSPLSPLSPARVHQQQQNQQGAKMSSYTKSTETKITKIEITQPQQQPTGSPGPPAVQQEISPTPSTTVPPVQINPPTPSIDSFDNDDDSQDSSELNLGSPIGSSTGRERE